MRRAAVGLVAALLLCASCAKISTADVPSPDQTPSRYVLTVRADGPRWLGPGWWHDLGLDAESVRQKDVTLLRDDVPVPLYWLDSPDGPGALFYGQTASSESAAAAAYVLVLGETDEALAQASVPLSDRIECQAATTATLRLEEDLAYRSTAPFAVPWLWQMLRPFERMDVPVQLPGVLPNEPISLTVHAWGQSAMPQDPDHHLRVVWNGEVVEDHFWDGSEPETWSLLLPATATVDNVLTLEAPGGTEAPVEVTWIDALEVTWRRNLAPDGDSWQTWRAESDGVACWPTGAGDADRVALLVDLDGRASRSDTSVDAGSGRIRVAQRAGDVGWIGVPWMASPPDGVRPEETLLEESLEDTSYVVVAPALFHDALGALLAARRSEGHDARLITPGAVYDTFGRGVPEASAIQTMVRDLHERGSLQYLVLVGDASPHPDAVWQANSMVVPTGWVQTAHVGHTASDYALATGGTEEALVAVGRIPVSTLDELRRVVDKTLAWRPSSRLLLVSDDEAEFATMVQRLGEGQDVDRVIGAGTEDVRRELFGWLGDGPGTLVYSGHGSLQLLGDEKLLTVEDGQNWQQPTVVATWSCLCAAFAHPTHQSLGEALILAPKGVVAFVGPTGETTTSEQMAMAVAFQMALADGETVGDALLRGWRASTSGNSRHGFLLLGDPALRPMPIPEAGGSGDD
jgi:hypothetical protein